MASSCGERKLAALFTECVASSADWELAIDETASMVSLASNVCVVPGMSVVVREGKECVQDLLDHLSGEESAARYFVLEGKADDNASFVDILSGITAVGDAEPDGCTFVDGLARATLSVEMLATHLVCIHVSLLSSFPDSF